MYIAYAPSRIQIHQKMNDCVILQTFKVEELLSILLKLIESNSSIQINHIGFIN